MAESVKVLPKDTQEMIDVHEWDLRTLEGVKRFREIGARSLPSIAIEGTVVYSSIIPGQEDLIEEISRQYQEKNSQHHILKGQAMKIEILGTGCKSCDTLYNNVVNALEKTGQTDTSTVEKSSDIDYFMKMGVFTTPGLVVEGKLISSGQVLTEEKIVEILNTSKSD